MSEPAVIAPSPVKDAKGQGGGEGHQNSKPRPKAKQKSDAEIEIEKNWDFPTQNPSGPSGDDPDDCMEIDLDKPGACDLV